VARCSGVAQARPTSRVAAPATLHRRFDMWPSW
jgi:hypothetical protein